MSATNANVFHKVVIVIHPLRTQIVCAQKVTNVRTVNAYPRDVIVILMQMIQTACVKKTMNATSVSAFQ